VVGAATALGLGLLPWSPLGRGVLTGKYRHGVPADSRAASREHAAFTSRYLDDDSAQVVDAVTIAARGLGVSATEVALAWVRDRPGVVAPIVGARTTAQLRTALASEQLELPDELVSALDDVSD
jgi:aryl-alcohol dehydrogenase-like predicted oxidoreductase